VEHLARLDFEPSQFGQISGPRQKADSRRMSRIPSIWKRRAAQEGAKRERDWQIEDQDVPSCDRAVVNHGSVSRGYGDVAHHGALRIDDYVAHLIAR
jgi:hypothetical protein